MLRCAAMKYWAFISYSHVDAAVGAWLHKALESYRVPKKLVGGPGRDGPVPARLVPVFRDREELPVSADLNDNISTALAESRYLIVVCSPNAAVSRWVNEEVLTFKRLGRANRILTVIADGEPGTSAECFPPALRFLLDESGNLSSEPTEPIAADLRPGKDGKGNALLKIVAGLLGVNYDNLRERHARRRRRQIAAIAIATTLIVGTAATVFGTLWRRTMEARRAQASAESGAALDRGFALMAGGPSREALAWFARAARIDPESPAAKTALMMALRDWQFPRWHLDGDIAAVAAPSRGSLIATLDAKGGVAVWNLATGVRQPLTSLPAKAAAIVFDDAGTHLLAALGNTISDIDVAADRRTDVALPGAGEACFFFLDAGVLWAGTPGQLWRASAGAAPVRVDVAINNAVPSCYGMHFSRRGRRLAISSGTDVTLVDLQAQTSTSVVTELTIDGLELSADGSMLMVSSGERAYRLIDAATGRTEGAEISSGGVNTFAMAVNPVTSTFAISDERGGIAVSPRWPSAREDRVDHVPGSGPLVRRITFDRDGQRMLSVDADDRVRLWTSIDRMPVVFPEIPGLSFGAFTSDPLVIVTIGQDGADVWNLRLRGAGVIEVPQEHGSQVPEIRFSTNGDRFAGQTWSNANVWARATGEPLARLVGSSPNGWDDPPAMSDDIRYGLTWSVNDAESETDVQIHDIDGRRVLREWKLPGMATAAAFSADAGQVAVATKGSVFIAAVSGAASPRALPRIALSKPIRRLGWSADATSLVLLGDERTTIVSTADGAELGALDCVTTAELNRDPTLAQWNRETKTIGCVTAASSGAWLRVGAPGAAAASGQLPAGTDADAVMGERGLWLVSTSGSDLRIVNLKTAAVTLVAVPRGGRVVAVNDARGVAAIETSSGVKLITLADAQWSGQSMRHQDPVAVARFSDDGRFLATGAGTKAYLWDAASTVGQAVGPAVALPNNALSLRFSPDGRSLAIGAAQGWGSTFAPGVIVVLDLLVDIQTDAARLADLAEAVAESRVNDLGAVVALPPDANRLAALRSTRDPFLAWFFADPWTRAVGPGSALDVPGYLNAKLRSGQFLEAVAEFPGHPLFAENRRDVFVRPLDVLSDAEKRYFEPMFSSELEPIPGLSEGPPPRLVKASVKLTDEAAEQWMVVVVEAAGFCGSGGCHYPATVFRKVSDAWTVAGDGDCDAAGDGGLVRLTTYKREGHADFFCGTKHFIWTGSRYVQENADG
ncbi:MAG: TIR domain-containing protein [Acidobacteria bacterium]|nr:MAG: TIR domain-containing protein [Acidobacteriota bacterium]